MDYKNTTTKKYKLYKEATRMPEAVFDTMKEAITEGHKMHLEQFYIKEETFIIIKKKEENTNA